MLNSQGSRSDFQCGQGVKHEILMDQDFDPGRGWKYRHLCSVPRLVSTSMITFSRLSGQDSLPLISRIVVNPVSIGLNGTVVNCFEGISSTSLAQ